MCFDLKLSNRSSYDPSSIYTFMRSNKTYEPLNYPTLLLRQFCKIKSSHRQIHLILYVLHYSSRLFLTILKNRDRINYSHWLQWAVHELGPFLFFFIFFLMPCSCVETFYRNTCKFLNAPATADRFSFLCLWVEAAPRTEFEFCNLNQSSSSCCGARTRDHFVNLFKYDYDFSVFADYGFVIVGLNMT